MQSTAYVNINIPKNVYTNIFLREIKKRIDEYNIHLFTTSDNRPKINSLFNTLNLFLQPPGIILIPFHQQIHTNIFLREIKKKDPFEYNIHLFTTSDNRPKINSLFNTLNLFLQPPGITLIPFHQQIGKILSHSRR